MADRRPRIDEPASALRRIPILECGEALAPFIHLSKRLLWVEEHPVFDYQRVEYARTGLAVRLAAAAETLPDGLCLAIVEAWRPPAIQQAMHRFTRERLRRENPDWSASRLSRQANRFSAQMDEGVPPPHTTGGAVDLQLVAVEGGSLDMNSPYALTDPGAAPMAARGLSREARRNRQLLREALEPAGITNYPAEWWHWSYGDQGWAYRGGLSQAHYGAIEPPDWRDAEVAFRVRSEIW